MLDRLAREHGVTTLGVRISGIEHIVVVAAAQGGANIQIAAQVGSRFPALLSATGRCIAAFGNYPEAQLEAKFRTLRWDNPPLFEEWQAQVEATRTQGYGVDESNYIAGVTVVAAPVWGAASRPSHALVGIGLARLLHVEAGLLASLMGVFAGFFLYVGASELLPRARQAQPSLASALSVLLGLALIWIVVQMAAH